jgi:hypothetical protein
MTKFNQVISRRIHLNSCRNIHAITQRYVSVSAAVRGRPRCLHFCASFSGVERILTRIGK